MTKLVFRQATINDFDRFYSFFKISIKELFPHYSENGIRYIISFDYPKKYLFDQLNRKIKRLYLCFSNNRIIGYILFHQQLAGVSFANWLAVDKSYQKQGIASKLITLWEKKAFKEGAHSLQLWTTKNNIEFYQGNGFINAGVFPKAWHGIDTFLFYKHLRQPDEKLYLKKYIKLK